MTESQSSKKQVFIRRDALRGIQERLHTSIQRGRASERGNGGRQLSARRGSDSAAQPERGMGEGGVRRPVQPGSISAVGVHYSKAPRKELSIHVY